MPEFTVTVEMEGREFFFPIGPATLLMARKKYKEIRAESDVFDRELRNQMAEMALEQVMFDKKSITSLDFLALLCAVKAPKIKILK